MPGRPELKLDWCSYAAAKYAVEHWHYSRSMPGGRNVYVGAWEDTVFIGVIMFGLGSGNATNGVKYGLARSHEMAELVRIALSVHLTPVSRIVALALRMIKYQSPLLQLIISMADPRHGHHGGIYQAGNWVYAGCTAPDYEYFLSGMWRHHRSATSRAGSVVGLPSRKILGKYRYLYPLNAAMRAQIAPLAQPYPKRATSILADAPAVQVGESGAAPTVALHMQRGD